MKIYLDLLPKEKKKELKRKKLFRKILHQEILSLFPVFVFVVILCNIYYLLSFEQENVVASQSIEQSKDKYKLLGSYEEKFKQINTETDVLLKIQAGHLHWHNIFEKLNADVPEGVVITNFSTKDYAVFLVGKAKNRDILLNFKSKLEADDCFDGIDVPLSNLVVKENVDFQMDFLVKQNCLRE